jgi:hypothetical protein
LPYWTKSGGCTNYAQSRIFHMDNPRLDVVLNTDTDTLPGCNHGDNISLNTGTMFMDTYYLLNK